MSGNRKEDAARGGRDPAVAKNGTSPHESGHCKKAKEKTSQKPQRTL